MFQIVLIALAINHAHQVAQIFSFGGFELDAAHRRLSRAGEPLTLHAKAFDLLVFLVEHAGRVVSREEILDAVWDGQAVEEANLTVQISALRKILRDQKTRRGFWLRSPAEVTSSSNDNHPNGALFRLPVLGGSPQRILY